MINKMAVWLGALAMVLLLATPVSAHDNSSESITLEVNDQRVVGAAPVAFAGLGYRDTSGDGLIDAAEVRDQEAELSSTIVETVRANTALTVDGQETQIIGAGVVIPDVEEGEDSAGEFVSLVITTGPHDGDISEVTLDWAFDSPSNEVVLAHPDGVVVAALGDDGTASFSFGLWASVSSFFALGIEHIRFGLDHLLFLFVLTLAVAGTTVTREATWRTVKLVTAFTVGHAASLCLAYFDLITVPAGVVEPAISLSIVAAALLAMRGRASEARPWIAAAIGLVHGLGFASSLGTLGVATSQRAPALAAFNLGIDVAQTVVVLTVIAALWGISRVLADRMIWVRIPSAALAAIVGVAWTVARLTSVPL